MSRLAISLLGPVRVSLGGDVVNHFGVDAAQALLAYLVMRPEIPHRREALAALLWPNDPRVEGLRNLRQTLQSMREAISDGGVDPAFLHITRQTLQVNSAADYWLDVALFENLVQATRRHRHRRLEECRSCIDRLEQATELYRGDFMTGFSYDSFAFEEWLVVHQQRFHLDIMDLLAQLTSTYMRMGMYDPALGYARRRLELESWDEEAHRLVMRLLAFKGQRSAALAHYEMCCRTLQEELGVAPMPETTSLYYQIRRGEIRPLAAQEHAPRDDGGAPGAWIPDVAFSVRHNIPSQVTPFVGREASLSRVVDHLLDPADRLVTIVGPGGVGKTRLALAAAESVMSNFPSGTWFVHLAGEGGASVQGDVVARLVADVLNISISGRRPVAVEVLDFLSDKHLLLILDNVECLIDEGVALIHDLLRAAPKVTLLVTSRERLHLQSEVVIELAGLPVPSSALDARAETYSSVRLLAERAERLAGEFVLDSETLREAVRICRAVDGYPLGIELAAAWIGKMGLEEIADLVEKDLDRLVTTMRDVPPRHRSMRAVFEGSWKLLGQSRRMALAKLSVFAGSFDGEGGGAVAEVDEAVLQSLVDKSLLRRNSEGRYAWHDLVHQFAVEKLEELGPQVKEASRRRHSDYYLTFVSQKAGLLGGEDSRFVLAQVRAELDHIQQACKTAVAQAHFSTLDLAIDDLAYFLRVAGLFRLGEEVFGGMVSRLRIQMDGDDVAPLESRRRLGRFLVHLAYFLNSQTKHSQAKMVAQAVLEHLDEAEDPPSRAAAFLQLGKALWARGDLEQGQQFIERALALARTNELRPLEAEGMFGLVAVHEWRSSYAKVEAWAMETLAIYQEIGDRRGEAMVLNWLGGVAMRRGDYSQAWVYYEESRQIGRQIGDYVNEQGAILNLGIVLGGRGMYDEARAHFEQALRSFRESGQRLGECRALRRLGQIYLHLGDLDAARNCLEPALQISREIHNREEEAAVYTCLGWLAQRLEDLDGARSHADRALAICRATGNRGCERDALLFQGYALSALERWSEAEWAFGQAVVLQVEVNLQLPPVEAMAGMAMVACASGRADEAMVWIREIAVQMDARPGLPETQEPLQVYWTAYQVLAAQQDPRSEEALVAAYALLEERASRIAGERRRRIYLESTPAHRNIIRAWEQLQRDLR